MQIFNQKVAASTGRNLVPPGPRVPATDAIGPKASAPQPTRQPNTWRR